MKILSKYEITILENGEILLKPLNISQKNVDYTKCSSRITQILLLVEKIREISMSDFTGSDIDVYTRATVSVAQTLEVARATVNDKMTRQLGLTAEEARQLIFGYLRKHDMKLKELLLKNVGNSNRDADTATIKQVLV